MSRGGDWVLRVLSNQTGLCLSFFLQVLSVTFWFLWAPQISQYLQHFAFTLLTLLPLLTLLTLILILILILLTLFKPVPGYCADDILIENGF